MWIVPVTWAFSVCLPYASYPLISSNLLYNIFIFSTESYVSSIPITRTTEFARILEIISNELIDVEGIFSNHKVSNKLVPASTKSFSSGWFFNSKAVKVSGKCKLFKIPPSGKVIPVILVPSKYTSSKFVQPLASTDWVKLVQFRTSNKRNNVFLPNSNCVK